MTEALAQVINHPTLQKIIDLKQQIRDLSDEIGALEDDLDKADDLADDLETGRKDWTAWFDGPPFPGAQEQAALEAWLFAGELRNKLFELRAKRRALDAKAGGVA